MHMISIKKILGDYSALNETMIMHPHLQSVTILSHKGKHGNHFIKANVADCNGKIWTKANTFAFFLEIILIILIHSLELQKLYEQNVNNMNNFLNCRNCMNNTMS